jgi:hypothetical protein
MKLPKPGNERLILDKATTEDVARCMVRVIHASSRDPLTVSTAYLLRESTPAETVENFCNYVFKAAYMQPDLPTEQTIRTLRRLISDGCGNCVDYSVALASMSVALNLPVTLALVQFPGAPNFGHVYPVICGIIADVVPWQKQDGSERRTRPPGSKPKIGITAPHQAVKYYQV